MNFDVSYFGNTRGLPSELSINITTFTVVPVTQTIRMKPEDEEKLRKSEEK